MTELGADDLAAAAVAYEAGQLLLRLREAHLAGRSAGHDAPDLASNELITRRLAGRFPTDAVLSEEAADTPERLGRDRVWIVDPLDGTREYNEEGRSDWAVHVALVEHGALCAGAVALPALGALHSTAAAFPRGPRATGPLRLVVSRTRPPAEAQTVVEALGAALVPMGSAGAKAMAVVRGEVDGYVHAGGQYEWDSAAPVAVALASGLHASRLDGSPFAWNAPNPWLPDLLICRMDLADSILAALRAR